MIHSWQKLSLCNCNTRTRLGLVLEDVGPSMTITSLTNFISFGIGVFTPTPEIRLFCFATALALGLGYLFELVLFGPILAIATRYERKKSTKRTDTKPEESSLILRIWRRKMDGCLKFLLNFYCFILQLPPFTLTVIAAMALYLYFSIIGVVTIQTRLDPSKILPANSPIQIPNKMLNDIVWAEYHPLTVIVNKEIDLRSVKEMNRFWELVDAYESLQGCRGSTSTLLWIRDYATYCRNVAPMVNNFFSYFGYSSKTDEVNDGNSTGLNYDELKNFLSIYDHWRAFVRLKDTREGLRVRKFIFVVAYANMSTWDDRINIMQKWREIAGGFKDLNVTVWEANGMFVDQMLSLKSIAIQTGIVTLICMTAVCTIFIPNPCSVISASVSIASISLGELDFLA
ncbi:hypothetical protein AB6A40_009513 [Gnathostoma spinigerum]|uniref:SSD domain-containing protein n=1 Tax=Gnathostoma spinigerum TaxID=75299 RepID=A0ABD6EZN9_9BILA